jgi:hypothetical protein
VGSVGEHVQIQAATTEASGAGIRGLVQAARAPTQFGFVPDRQVHDAIDVWTALQNLVKAKALPQSATAVLLDFAKAYDTLDRSFLTRALHRLRFPSQFIEAVDAMHLATTAGYLAENFLSSDHDVLNGIRQGCPLAPVLFILAVDTLYEAIAADPNCGEAPLENGLKENTRFHWSQILPEEGLDTAG